MRTIKRVISAYSRLGPNASRTGFAVGVVCFVVVTVFPLGIYGWAQGSLGAVAMSLLTGGVCAIAIGLIVPTSAMIWPELLYSQVPERHDADPKTLEQRCLMGVWFIAFGVMLTAAGALA